MISSLDRLLGTLSYVIAAFSGMLIVGCRLPKKVHFTLRAASACAFICLMRYLLMNYVLPALQLPMGTALSWIICTINLQVFVLCFFSVGFCYNTNIWAMLFCATAGYSLQFITHKLYELIPLLVYSPTKLEETLLVLLIAAIIYMPIWYYHFRRVNYWGMYQAHKPQIVIAVAFVLITIYLSVFAGQAASQTGSLKAQVYQNIYATVMIIAVLVMECSILAEKNLRSERDELKHLIEQQRERYLQEKKNIDLVNIRCHDIRHQLREMEGSIEPEAMKRITDAINIYDSKVETGNEAISVVLAKHSLYCAKHGIRLSCMIDGDKLSFIPPHELYALFGNAIENAVHAVRQLDREKRVISVTEQIVGNLMNISFMNYFSGELEYEDGLPVNRAENHGYGVKSIRMIAEEYGGRINVETKGDLFILNIFFPLPVSAA